MDDLCDRVICLTLGWEHCPRSISLEGGGDEVLRLPVCAILVHGPTGWTLLETGMSDRLRDADYARRWYTVGDPQFPSASDPLLGELARCGCTAADISAVAVSHLHLDHSGGLVHFQDGPEVFIQRRELEFAGSAAALDQAYVPADYDLDVHWNLLDGDSPIVPGVDAVSTPGHTPGHMSYRVRTPAATWLFAVDAIDLQEGIDDDVPIGAAADPADDHLRRASHDRLLGLARAERAVLAAGHCPVTWPTRPGPPDGWSKAD